MKAILIDPKNKTVEELNLPEYKNIASLIDCQYFDGITVNSFNDFMYVDDMGLLKENYLFYFSHISYAFAGKAIILGVDEEGSSKDCGYNIDEVRSLVRFCDEGPRKVINR